MRYSRQTSLPDFGMEGQRRLTDARVLVIGAGGLGSPAALYLAAAGVGHIYIADGDNVEVSNLQRQIIHTTARENTPKALSARTAMLELNPDIEVTALVEFLSPERLAELLQEIRPHFVIDATDSFDAKFFINDVCVAAGIPCSYGAIFRYEGQLTTWIPGAPTLRDLFPAVPAPEKTKPVGPLGVVPGIIGTLQAAEAIKQITGIGCLLTGTLLYFNILTMDFNRITYTPR
ncbi:MAG: HesA/MoeB/ThiF family protein [Barnesiella sp.]|nr:HesA/MoeB/ThiF family protein [Barnesiella sp.]